MHPALSVIFFTVTSGAGYGLLVLLALARMTGLVPDISPDQIVVTGAIGLVLVTAGLISSTFHLASPKNAWRSFVRFRTSWLSREAVFAVLFYPLCLAWLVAEWFSGNGLASLVLATLTLFMAIAILFCTGMIYAQLKTIRQWHTALTPLNFILLGIFLGCLILLVVAVQQQLSIKALLVVSIAALLIAAGAKVAYFLWIGQPAGPTINTALGFTRATVRLLDVGHASDTFLTKEFGYQVARVRLMWTRVISLLLSFVVPLVLLSGLTGELNVASVVLAAISAYAGIFAERWLFFAEARHVVNLYHGAQRT